MINQSTEPGLRKQRKIEMNEDTTGYTIQCSENIEKQVQQLNLSEKDEATQINLLMLNNKQEISSSNFQILKNEFISIGQVQFRSQRERYGNLGKNSDSFNLPQKLTILYNKFKQIDYNIWKKKKVQLTGLELFRLRQILTIDNKLFKIKIIDKKKLEVSHPQQISENLNPFISNDLNTIQLPNILKLRQNQFKQELDTIIQMRHQKYLIENQIEIFTQISQSLKIYHPDFQIENQNDIIPYDIEGIEPLHDQNQSEQLKSILAIILDYFHKRGVSFMLRESMLKKINNENQKLTLLSQLLPDIIRIPKENEQIIQINNDIDHEQLLSRLDLYLQ